MHLVDIFFVRSCQLEENVVKSSHKRKEDKFSDSQIFHFDESSKSMQRILLAFGLLLLFSHRTRFIQYFEYCWYSYLGVHSDRVLSIWVSPAKFKQFQPIYRFFKPEKLSQTQEIWEVFTKFCLKAYFQTWLCYLRK